MQINLNNVLDVNQALKVIIVLIVIAVPLRYFPFTHQNHNVVSIISNDNNLTIY